MVTLKEWHRLLKTASEYDLDAGGFADPRGGCIAFWVGPYNKPEGYAWEITAEALSYPREYLGEVSPEWRGDEIVAWKVYTINYSQIRDLASPKDRGKAVNVPEHVEWVQKEFSRLHREILGREVDVPFVVWEDES